MQPNLKTPLVEYHYDALNRLVASTPSAQATAQRFYQKNQLITEVQGAVKRSIMQSDGQPLAQQQRQGGATVETSLLAIDLQESVLNVLGATQSHALAYTPYGHRPLGIGLLSRPGFNAEWPDPVTGCYLLGTGHHRPFNPVLMRFICPDGRSPFGTGWINAYAYCQGDPINRRDPTGHTWEWMKTALRFIRVMKKRTTDPLSATSNTNRASSRSAPGSVYDSVSNTSSKKTPARDGLPFALKEPHPRHAPSLTGPPESLTAYKIDHPNTPLPVNIPRRHRKAPEIIPLWINSDSTNPINRVEQLSFDPLSPSARQRIQQWVNELQPGYQQTMTERASSDALSKRQSDVRQP